MKNEKSSKIFLKIGIIILIFSYLLSSVNLKNFKFILPSLAVISLFMMYSSFIMHPQKKYYNAIKYLKESKKYVCAVTLIFILTVFLGFFLKEIVSVYSSDLWSNIDSSLKN